MAPPGNHQPFTEDWRTRSTRPRESKIAPATPKATGRNRDRTMMKRLTNKRPKLCSGKIHKEIDNQLSVACGSNFGAGMGLGNAGDGSGSAEGADCRGQSAYARAAAFAPRFGGHARRP